MSWETGFWQSRPSPLDVAIDLQGYRTGALNETLESELEE
jgi:hypothetical protein